MLELLPPPQLFTVQFHLKTAKFLILKKEIMLRKTYAMQGEIMFFRDSLKHTGISESRDLSTKKIFRMAHEQVFPADLRRYLICPILIHRLLRLIDCTNKLNDIKKGRSVISR